MAVQHTLNGFYEEQADRRADLRAVVPLSPGDKREGRRRAPACLRCVQQLPFPLASHLPVLPPCLCRYVHRVGRTGRAGQAGTAITLLAPADADFAAELAAMLAQPGDGDDDDNGGAA